MIALASGIFVTSSATSAGKTYVSRAVTRSLQRCGLRVAALKPIETGVDPDPLDAIALARAAGQPDLAHVRHFYRARLPLAPYAASLETGEPGPDLHQLAVTTLALARDYDRVIVEGAGGLLVPLDAKHCIAELARALQLPLVIVAPDQLGVLSAVITCYESARARELAVAAVILSQRELAPTDPSPRTNQRILAERLPCPVLHFPLCRDDDDALADAADAIGLPKALGLAPSPAPVR